MLLAEHCNVRPLCTASSAQRHTYSRRTSRNSTVTQLQRVPAWSLARTSWTRETLRCAPAPRGSSHAWHVSWSDPNAYDGVNDDSASCLGLPSYPLCGCSAVLQGPIYPALLGSGTLLLTLAALFFYLHCLRVITCYKLWHTTIATSAC